jgi:quinol monooxygenase YgiN
MAGYRSQWWVLKPIGFAAIKCLACELWPDETFKLELEENITATEAVTVGLFVRLEAKAGKEAEVEKFLRDGLSIVQQERATTAWFAIRVGPTTFGIFDVFPDESGRQAHLSGRVAAALTAKAPELFAQSPKIEKLDVVAAKLS